MNTTCLWRWLGGWCVEDSRSRPSGRRLPLSLSKVLNFGRVMTSHALDKPPTAWFRESPPVYLLHSKRSTNVEQFAGRTICTE